jgi:hypothetical protein
MMSNDSSDAQQEAEAAEARTRREIDCQIVLNLHLLYSDFWGASPVYHES